MVDFKSRGNLSLEVDNLLINHKNEEQWTHRAPTRITSTSMPTNPHGQQEIRLTQTTTMVIIRFRSTIE